MKRYWVFAGDNHYPNGGMEDYMGSFESKKAAEAWVRANPKFKCNYSGRNEDMDWWHILDMFTMEIVSQSGDCDYDILIKNDKVIGRWER